MRPAAAGAFRRPDDFNRRPALRTEVEVFFRKNPNAASPAEGGQEKVFESQRHCIREQAENSVFLSEDRAYHFLHLPPDGNVFLQAQSWLVYRIILSQHFGVC
jgi:hypothetical protein